MCRDADTQPVKDRSMTANLRPGVLANDYFAPLKARADEIERLYRQATPASQALFERGSQVFPGGFTRDAVMRSPYAPFFRSGKGVELIDRDGRRIVDFWFNATSLPLGHADDRVIAAVAGQLSLGSAFFGMTEREVELAELLTARLPSAERIRFANSGSEAVMMALRIARGFTGRNLVIKFEGAYHGTYDDVQWSVGPSPKLFGDARRPTPVPDTAGLPGGEGRILVLPYGNAEVLAEAMAVHGSKVACIIVEPMCNRIGLVIPPQEFFQAARALCDAHGAVLIFDEVIAFRLGYRGAQGIVGVTPDLTTLGKIIGGGFPVGGVAGRADILAVSDPGAANRVAHAGTFNANPVTAAAGLATMTALDEVAFERINALGAEVRRRLAEIVAGLPLTVTGAGSLFKINATAERVTDYRSAITVDGGWEKLVSQLLLIDGYMLTPTLHGCVSTVSTQDHVEGFLAAFASIVRS